MSPNGRRRWRRRAAKVRYAQQREHRTGDAIFAPDERHYAAWDRRHWRSWTKEAELRGDGPQKGDIATRSLVGMTAGAKKRKAFADWCRMGMRAWATHAQTWRVGERLRPCNSCNGHGWGPCKERMPKARECDGSGVLPARKARKARG